jgi:hypothetical protein
MRDLFGGGSHSMGERWIVEPIGRPILRAARSIGGLEHTIPFLASLELGEIRAAFGHGLCVTHACYRLGGKPARLFLSSSNADNS